MAPPGTKGGPRFIYYRSVSNGVIFSTTFKIEMPLQPGPDRLFVPLPCILGRDLAGQPGVYIHNVLPIVPRDYDS